MEVIEKEDTEEVKKDDEEITEDAIKEPPSITIRINKKMLLISIITIVVIVNLAIFSTGFALANINNPGIVAGITVNGIDLHGLNREQAIQALSEEFNIKLEREILVKTEGFETIISPFQIEARFNIEEVVDEVYGIGRTGNIFQNNFDIMRIAISNRNMELELIYNTDLLNEIIMDIAVRLPNTVLDPSFFIEGNNLVITRGVEGVSISGEETRNLILDEILNNTGEAITLNLINVQPRPINIDEIYSEIYREPRNAYYTEEPFEVFSHIYGITFDLEEARRALAEYREEYIIPLTITVPEITIPMLGDRIFADLLGSFSTRFDASNRPRTRNLELASASINETILMPGEIFSFNRVVGRRTAAAGYQEAPRICWRKSSPNAWWRNMSAIFYSI